MGARGPRRTLHARPSFPILVDIGESRSLSRARLAAEERAAVPFPRLGRLASALALDPRSPTSATGRPCYAIKSLLGGYHDHEEGPPLGGRAIPTVACPSHVAQGVPAASGAGGISPATMTPSSVPVVPPWCWNVNTA